MKQYSTSKISHHFSVMQNVTLSQGVGPHLLHVWKSVSAKHASLAHWANAWNGKTWSKQATH